MARTPWPRISPGMSMHQHQRWLICGLVALLPWLGLGMAQRQALGPLHVHATPAGGSTQPGAEALLWALHWWWSQVQQQTHARQHAHAHAHLHMQANEGDHAHAPATTASAGQTHRHAAWQRHHHDASDSSVVALGVPGEDLGTQVATGAGLMPWLGWPADGLPVLSAAATQRHWALAGPAHFSSWGTAPPLRPPRA